MTENLLLSLAVLLVLGIGAQWIAWRVGLPSILLLLLGGFAAGPVMGWLHPDEIFGPLLMPLVSISVGLILFEGGLTLKFSELKAVGSVVRNLITLGALATWIFSALAAHWLLEWDWPLSMLLGAILIVTGPTVIMPLLRHVKPSRQVASTLKWEGILIDPIGALVALLVFEAIVSHGDASVPLHTMASLGKTVVIGGVLGYLGGLVLKVCFQHYWIPDFLQNPVAFMTVVANFTISNYFQHESGLLTVTVMGIVLANQTSVHIRHIVEFKENLRVLLISSLFILLSARVQWEEITRLSLGHSLAFLLAMMLVVRPLSVLLSTIGSPLKWTERAFLSWMAPRGIVAAAVASIFALRLAEAGHPNASQLVSVTFLIIVGTVTIYGLSSAPLAKWLKLSTPNPQGVLFVGATRLARTLAKELQEAGFYVLLADTNRENTSLARMQGLPVFEGNLLADEARDELELTGLGRLLALTPNNEVNTFAALHFREFFGTSEVYQVLVHKEDSRRTKSEPHGRLVFGREVLYRDLVERLSQGQTTRATKLTDTFDFEAWKSEHGQKSIPLFLITEDKRLRILTAEGKAEPESGQTIIALGPPKENSSASEASVASPALP